jgi:drug/metabolite transporter (DMT)-like permease
MPFSENLLKFLVLCLVWGLTWIATKVGIGAVPPLLFAATRFIAAGMIVSLWVWREIHFSEWQKNDVIRLFAASLLMVTLTYGPLFWGMRYVSSGTAGVLEMSLTPIALLGFGIALGQERWSWVNAIAMALGIAGLCILFAPSIKADEGSGAWSIVGFVAIAWAAVSYAWGSVLARPVIERYGSGMLSGATMLIGGAALLLGSLGWEPNSAQSLEAFWGGLRPWAGSSSSSSVRLSATASTCSSYVILGLLRPAASHSFLLSLRCWWVSSLPERPSQF